MSTSTGRDNLMEAVDEPLERLGTRIVRRFVGVGLTEPLLEVHPDAPPDLTLGQLGSLDTECITDLHCSSRRFRSRLAPEP